MTTDITSEMIYNEFKAKGVFIEAVGLLANRILRIAPVEDAMPGDMVFVDKEKYLGFVKNQRPAAVVTSPALKEKLLSEVSRDDLAILIAPNVGVAHALVKQKYADRDFSKSGWSGVHSSAVVHETAELEEGVVIEPRVVIGKNVKIGGGTRIMAGVVIENDAVIGQNCLIHPLVVIGYGSKLGNEVEIGSGTIIGSIGFSFAQDKNRKSHAIPQTGIVVIEDRVRLGANNTVDRAAYKVTRIGAGTKTDNLCHFAHNVDIGEDCILTSMFCIAGSTKIGNRMIASGQTGIIDHLSICDDVVLLHKAGVSKDITTPGAYAGTPIQPLGEYMKNTAVLRTATELRKRIGDLEKAMEKK